MMPVTVTVALLAYTTLFRSLVVAVGLGLKAAVTPLGSVEGDRVTLPVKPFCGETVIVLEPLLPWVTVRLPGEAERRSEERRVGKGWSAVGFDRVPDVPVMVRVTVFVVAVGIGVSSVAGVQAFGLAM